MLLVDTLVTSKSADETARKGMSETYPSIGSTVRGCLSAHVTAGARRGFLGTLPCNLCPSGPGPCSLANAKLKGLGPRTSTALLFQSRYLSELSRHCQEEAPDASARASAHPKSNPSSSFPLAKCHNKGCPNRRRKGMAGHTSIE